MNDQRPPDQDPDPEVDVDAAFRDIVARLDQDGLSADTIARQEQDPDTAVTERDESTSQTPTRSHRPGPEVEPQRPRQEIDLTDSSTANAPDAKNTGPKNTDANKTGAKNQGKTQPEKPATNPPMSLGKKRTPGPSRPTKSRGINNSPRSYELAEPDDAFTPDPPPSWSSFSGRSYLTWIPLAGSLIFLLICAVFWRSAPTGLLYFAVALFAGGVVMLFTGLSNERDEGDDGARF